MDGRNIIKRTVDITVLVNLYFSAKYLHKTIRKIYFLNIIYCFDQATLSEAANPLNQKCVPCKRVLYKKI